MPRPQLILSFQQPFGTQPEAFQSQRGPPKTIRPGLQAWLAVSTGCHGDQPSHFPMAEQQLSLGEGFSFPSSECRPFCLVWGRLGGSARQQSPQPTPLQILAHLGARPLKAVAPVGAFPLRFFLGCNGAPTRGTEASILRWVSTPCRGWGGSLPSSPKVHLPSLAPQPRNATGRWAAL